MFRNCCYDRQNTVNNEFNAENMAVDLDIDINSNQMAPAMNMANNTICLLYTSSIKRNYCR